MRARERTNFQDACARDAEKAVEIVQAQYDGGTVDLTPVTLLQQTLVQQQDVLVQAQGEIATGLIQVYRALGGGWQIRCTDCVPKPLEARPQAVPAKERHPPSEPQPCAGRPAAESAGETRRLVALRKLLEQPGANSSRNVRGFPAFLRELLAPGYSREIVCGRSAWRYLTCAGRQIPRMPAASGWRRFRLRDAPLVRAARCRTEGRFAVHDPPGVAGRQKGPIPAGRKRHADVPVEQVGDPRQAFHNIPSAARRRICGALPRYASSSGCLPRNTREHIPTWY